MGRSPCCDKVGLKKGPWTPEEDQKLLAYIEEHGHGSWRSLPEKADLQRCGKSCRLRWTNYLRPDIKRGKFTLQEEQTIIQLHALLGNRWSAIATHLQKRTDNEIKNYWNTHLKKRLIKMGIDPVTHKPKNETLLSVGAAAGQSKNAATLSHMAQWESARLEAEARLARESKLRFQHYGHSLISNKILDKTTGWNWTKSNEGNNDQLESPTSTVSFSENLPPIMITSTKFEIPNNYDNNNKDKDSSIMPMIEFVRSSSASSETGLIKESESDWKNIEINSLSFTSSNLRDTSETIEEGFTSLLLSDSIDRTFSDIGTKDSENINGGSDYNNNINNYFEDNKNYWNSILNLVNSPPSDSPMF